MVNDVQRLRGVAKGSRGRRCVRVVDVESVEVVQRSRQQCEVEEQRRKRQMTLCFQNAKVRLFRDGSGADRVFHLVLTPNEKTNNQYS